MISAGHIPPGPPPHSPSQPQLQMAMAVAASGQTPAQTAHSQKTVVVLDQGVGSALLSVAYAAAAASAPADKTATTTAEKEHEPRNNEASSELSSAVFLFGHFVNGAVLHVSRIEPVSRDAESLPPLETSHSKDDSFLGWVRVVSPLVAPLPTAKDLRLQLALQTKHTACVGLLVQTTSANSRFFAEVAEPPVGAPLVAPVHCLRAFRVVTLAAQDQPDALHVEADEVFVTVLEQPYPHPKVLRSVNACISNSLSDSLSLYKQIHSHLDPSSYAVNELDHTINSYMLNVRRAAAASIASASIPQNSVSETPILSTISAPTTTTTPTAVPDRDLNGFIDVYTRIVADAKLKVHAGIDDVVSRLRTEFENALSGSSFSLGSGVDGGVGKSFDELVFELVETRKRQQNRLESNQAKLSQYLANINASVTVATTLNSSAGAGTNAAANNPYATAGIPGIINPSPYHQHFHHIHAPSQQQHHQQQQLHLQQIALPTATAVKLVPSQAQSTVQQQQQQQQFTQINDTGSHQHYHHHHQHHHSGPHQQSPQHQQHPQQQQQHTLLSHVSNPLLSHPQLHVHTIQSTSSAHILNSTATTPLLPSATTPTAIPLVHSAMTEDHLHHQQIQQQHTQHYQHQQQHHSQQTGIGIGVLLDLPSGISHQPSISTTPTNLSSLPNVEFLDESTTTAAAASVVLTATSTSSSLNLVAGAVAGVLNKKARQPRKDKGKKREKKPTAAAIAAAAAAAAAATAAGVGSSRAGTGGDMNGGGGNNVIPNVSIALLSGSERHDVGVDSPLKEESTLAGGGAGDDEDDRASGEGGDTNSEAAIIAGGGEGGDADGNQHEVILQSQQSQESLEQGMDVDVVIVSAPAVVEEEESEEGEERPVDKMDNSESKTTTRVSKVATPIAANPSDIRQQREVSFNELQNPELHDPNGIYPLCCRYHTVLSSRKSQQSLRSLRDEEGEDAAADKA
ncbi:UNVERIFIED_CONTAM: hypothetical protein HDU68_002815 [Siphonaria sp. JEL0065]|nr:hypothetical protein HDU68_002815 [Siphonaria sp. JEL0065]